MLMKTDKQAFDCQRCGHCCQGEGGIVMNASDRARLARHLGLEMEELLSRHTFEQGGKIFLKSREDGFCVFFDDGCSIHPARPNICRAWPFFKGNLIDEFSWNMIQDYCPGVNPEAGFALFVKQGSDYLEEHDLVEEEGGDGAEALRIDLKLLRE